MQHFDNNVYIHSFSKETAAPGLRMGCLVGSEPVAAKIIDYNSMFFSCHPALIQKALNSYLGSGDFFYEVLREQMPRRIKLADDILNKSQHISYVLPNAAFYMYIRISRLGVDADSFARGLLRAHGVCVCPGTGFGPTGRDYIRITLSGDEHEIYQGCETLIRYVEEIGSRGELSPGCPKFPAHVSPYDLP